jgi:hypothetical protein
MPESLLLEDYFATPIIIYPQMDEAEFAYELKLMKVREAATREFIAGDLDVEDWIEILDQSGTDVDAAVTDWDDGICYMG